MEAITTTIPLLFLIHFLNIIILDKFWPILVKFHPKYFSLLYCFLISHSDSRCNEAPIKEDAPNKTGSQPNVDIKDVRMNRDELTLAMEIIDTLTTKEGERIEDCMGYETFSALFEESEPSLDEVKDAFSVFDQNRDGLVDAGDLQRVLINLGLREGTDQDACKRMIKQHDRNGDGHVDLIDFSRLLEMSLLEKGD